MTIETYSGKYDEEIISLILDIQNNEAKINLSLDEQPDLKNIAGYYQSGGGQFWLAVENESVVGTIGLMPAENNCGILKKFFVRKDYRSKKLGLSLYLELLRYAKSKGINTLILDTPSVAVQSHKFYEKAGFKRISKKDLPIEYSYPDRNSYLYMLTLSDN